MKLIEWGDAHRIGVDIIDEQHKHMIDTVNLLYDTLGTRRTNEAKALSRQWLEELREHIDTEEKIMKENNFIDFFSHKLEHNRYYSKISNFYDDLVKGEVIVNLEILNSFKRWFVNHLEFNDRKIGLFLRKQKSE